MSYRPPSDPLARPKKDKKQPWPKTAICSIGRAASVPQRPRTIPTPPATSRCWRGWSPSASAPPCISAAPTSGRCTISWPRCSTTPWTRRSRATPTRSISSCWAATACWCATTAAACPVDPHPKFKNKSALEVILTTLHSGGKFNSKVYATSGGLHGVGVSVVNALSDELVVEVARDRQAFTQSFSRGKPTTKLKSAGPAPNRRGTTVTFHPDPQIFGKLSLRARAPLSHGAIQGLSLPRRRDPLEMRQGAAAEGRRDPRRGIVPLSRAA